MNDVIVDGVVLDKESIQDKNGREIFGYTIKVNDYFKGKQNAKVIYAKQLHAFPNFHLEKDDNALFYIRNTSEFGYVIQSHSVKTFGDCNARSLIEIIPSYQMKNLHVAHLQEVKAILIHVLLIIFHMIQIFSKAYIMA